MFVTSSVCQRRFVIASSQICTHQSSSVDGNLTSFQTEQHILPIWTGKSYYVTGNMTICISRSHEPSLKHFLNIRKTFLSSKRMVLKYREICCRITGKLGPHKLKKKTAFMPTCLAQKAKIITDDFQQTN